ncbi:hypothetical protein GQ600_21352 [Phytophthora cactorum]|nr:hypothetical protein GQ600_21352 [Phytophthora cactorum]
MEDEDFVADSDEDSRRCWRHSRRATNQQVERQEESREQNVTAVVTPEQPQAVQEQGGVQMQSKGEEEETEGMLEVGTLVEVESRTWPGINKQGGAGELLASTEILQRMEKPRISSTMCAILWLAALNDTLGANMYTRQIS